MEVSNELIESILYNDQVCLMYYDFNNNAAFFNGLSYHEIEKAIFKYLIDDLVARANAKMELPIDYYIACVKRIAQPYNNSATLTCNSLFQTLKTICYSEPYNNLDYISKWELEEFFDTQVQNSNDKNSEMRTSNLQYMMENNIYDGNFEMISHLVSIGYTGFNTQHAYEYIIKGIVDYGYNVNEYEYQSIMQKFAALVATSSGLTSCSIMLSSEESDALGSYYPFSLDVFGRNESVRKKITLNTNYLSPANVLDNLQTIFHEVRHGVQATKPYYKSYETLQFAKDLFLEEKFGEEYYEGNYWNISYESDARRISAYTTMRFLETFTDKGKKQYQSNYIKGLNRSKEINSRNLEGSETKFYSDVDGLFQIYAGEAINSGIRSIILQEYNENGKRRLITEFLENRKTRDKEFYDDLIYKHNYSLEEIKENALALMFYRPGSLVDKVEIGSKITFKLLDDLKKDVHIKGLNKIAIGKSKLKNIKSKINLILQQSLGKDLSLDPEIDNTELNENLEDTIEVVAKSR